MAVSESIPLPRRTTTTVHHQVQAKARRAAAIAGQGGQPRAHLRRRFALSKGQTAAAAARPSETMDSAPVPT